jgi:2-oxoglutarate dehydrogenase E2 component (dihydrolipoamide succinyltransferase)
MSIAVELPELGESVTEGTVSRWMVQAGDRVEMDQPLVEITTDKVDAEIPSPAAGVVEKLLVAEGDIIPVGAQLVMIDPSGAATGTELPAATQQADPVPPSAPGPSSDPEPRATPVARRIADDAHLDLGEVAGSGAAGRITKSDVLRHAVQATPEPAHAETMRAPAAPAPRSFESRFDYALRDGDRVIPMTPQRKLIAEHMVYSKHTSPHVGTVAEVDLGAVAALRRQHAAAFRDSYGTALTYLPFFVHATVRALREFPQLNASVGEDVIVEKRDVNVGIAAETEKGLVVPVVRNADRLSLAGLAAEIDDLGGRARSRKLAPDDLRGGTFTISNPGRKGNLYGFAIINQPQVGILRMGELVKRAVVRSIEGEDAIVIRPMMHLALSYDHRAVDGAPANGFLFRVRELLEAGDFDL